MEFTLVHVTPDLSSIMQKPTFKGLSSFFMDPFEFSIVYHSDIKVKAVHQTYKFTAVPPDLHVILRMHGYFIE